MRLPPVNQSAMGLLRVLLAASVLAPVALFVLASWVEYRAAQVEGERELVRSSEVAREQAAKLFSGQSQVADRVTDLVRGMGVAEIRRSELQLHNAFAAIVARLPQVQSVLLADRDGHPLVSAGTYPVPDVDLRGRDYFRAIIGGHPGTYVSSVQVGDVNRVVFFGLSQPWLGADGALLGVVDVAVLPSFFRDFYQVLIGEGTDGAAGKVMTLIRDDGQILVRYPPLSQAPPRPPAGWPFLTAIRAQPDQGVYDSRSIVEPDAPERRFAYRKVEGYPVYVVAGRSTDAIMADWRAAMLSRLLFGIPATLALIGVTWTALVRTRREAEALARARDEIARREQAEAALLAAQRLEAVGRMTGGVAHDFNNLLTMIMGGAESLLRRPDDSDRVRRIADQLLQVARRGGEVTQQLLAFARRQPVNPEILDLNRRLEQFKPLLEHSANPGIRIELELGAELAPVQLDPGQFEAAILNLVGNARDAMPEGGRIIIATGNRPPALVRVAVTDTGSGMEPGIAARAFEPFFTTKEVGRGTGLGLSQVYGFVKQAGGDVRIVSAPGAGTTVELLLPASSLPPDPERGGAAQAPTARGREVVLIVEDEPGVLDLAVESLRDLGYATLTAPHAQAALERLRGRERIDVLFSDVVMPGGMDGLELAAEAIRLCPEIKILLTSGYVSSFERPRPHGVPLLTKPYDRDQLAARLHAVLHE